MIFLLLSIAVLPGSIFNISLRKREADTTLTLLIISICHTRTDATNETRISQGRSFVFIATKSNDVKPRQLPHQPIKREKGLAGKEACPFYIASLVKNRHPSLSHPHHFSSERKKADSRDYANNGFKVETHTNVINKMRTSQGKETNRHYFNNGAECIITTIKKSVNSPISPWLRIATPLPVRSLSHHSGEKGKYRPIVINYLNLPHPHQRHKE
jgi:hypothetical protein